VQRSARATSGTVISSPKSRRGLRSMLVHASLHAGPAGVLARPRGLRRPPTSAARRRRWGPGRRADRPARVGFCAVQKRIWLDAPYAEKGAAKPAGARCPALRRRKARLGRPADPHPSPPAGDRRAVACRLAAELDALGQADHVPHAAPAASWRAAPISAPAVCGARPLRGPAAVILVRESPPSS